LLVLMVSSILSALAATNTVPPTRADDVGPTPITVNDLKPPECASLTLNSIVSCGNGNNCNAGNDNNLVLGDPNNNNIRGQNGNDCIVAASGSTSQLIGGNGTDVCIGYSTNTFDTTCETQVIR